MSIQPRRRARTASSPWPDEVFTTAATTAPLTLLTRGGTSRPLDPDRWHGQPGPADLDLLARTRGPVLDIGCGPGRLVQALVQAGRVALGIDASAAAVATTRRRGAPAVHASVFGSVPATGRWGTALLVDGNIGIGGDACALLRRAGDLVVPGGLLLVEVDAPTTASQDLEVCVERGGHHGNWFSWSTVSARDLPALAHSAGLELTDAWSHSGRWFAELVPGVSVEEEVAS